MSKKQKHAIESGVNFLVGWLVATVCIYFLRDVFMAGTIALTTQLLALPRYYTLRRFFHKRGKAKK